MRGCLTWGHGADMVGGHCRARCMPGHRGVVAACRDRTVHVRGAAVVSARIRRCGAGRGHVRERRGASGEVWAAHVHRAVAEAVVSGTGASAACRGHAGHIWGRQAGLGACEEVGCMDGGVDVGRAGAGGAGHGETATLAGTGGGGANVGLTALKVDAGARVLAFDAGSWQLQVRASFLARVAAHLRR